MTILIICVYALSRNKRAEIYIPSMFQASDIELLNSKQKLRIYLKLKIYKLIMIYTLLNHLSLTIFINWIYARRTIITA